MLPIKIIRLFGIFSIILIGLSFLLSVIVFLFLDFNENIYLTNLSYQWAGYIQIGVFLVLYLITLLIINITIKKDYLTKQFYEYIGNTLDFIKEVAYIVIPLGLIISFKLSAFYLGLFLISLLILESIWNTKLERSYMTVNTESLFKTFLKILEKQIESVYILYLISIVLMLTPFIKGIFL